MTHQFKPSVVRQAVTLLELMVVVLIISILASIATGVYTGETNRARVAAAHALIHNLEIAITRYEIDMGALPPSGTGQLPLTSPLTSPVDSRVNGSGYLHAALVHSLNGLTSAPAAWKGPYINLQADQIQLRSGQTSAPGAFDIIDPWGLPVLYFASPEYAFTGTEYFGGTEMFAAAAPAGANPVLPAPNPFAATERFYNARTFQLISYGPDGQTLPAGTGASYAGAAADDINNFGY